MHKILGVSINTRKLFLVSFLLTLFYISTCGQTISKYTGKYDEQFRPQFHFTPQQKWMNDPNGLVYYKGKYHLFYQYYPNDIVWGPMHWGHAESNDLIHWIHLPIALYPDSLGYIFSGSAVIDKNNTAGFGKNAMVAIFAYHNDAIWKAGKKNTESEGIAYSLDKGITWKKYSGNPVLNNSGEQDFRDPKVFWFQKDNCWKMVLAAGDRIKIFSSLDLKKWKFESDFKPVENTNVGVWECPDLFKMHVKNSKEEKWVIISNHGDNGPNGGSGTRYFVGDFDGKKFVNCQKAAWVDYGTDFYAAVTFGNVPKEKIILLGWMSNWLYATRTPTKVWRSAMTLPRELELVNENGRYFLYQKIVKQFSSISNKAFRSKSVKLPFDSGNMDFSQTEVAFDLAGENNLTIEFSNNLGEIFIIELTGSKLTTNRSRSGITSFSDSFADKVQIMPLGDDKVNSIQLILDKSSIEIFLNNGKYVMTNLFFPNKTYNMLSIKSEKLKSISNFKINKIKSIWK